jgi:DHA1 family quinolone resistance protein-like MFS transporter
MFSTSIITGRLSDILASRKIFIICGLIISAFSVLGLVTTHKLFFIFTRVVSGLGFGMVTPSLVASVSDHGDRMGSYSSMGSVGWAVGVLISGVIGLFWIPAIFIFGFLALITSVIISFSLHDAFSRDQTLVEQDFLNVFWTRKTGYLALGIRHSVANAIWTFWPLFLLSLGADTFWIAVIQFTNAFTQFVFMRIYTDRLKSFFMIILGLIFSALAFFSFTIPPDFWGIIPLQIILGISWAFLYVGVLRYTVEMSDFDKSTSAGIFSSTLSISGIFGPLIALSIISFGGDYATIMIIAAIVTIITSLGVLGIQIFDKSSKK